MVEGARRADAFEAAFDDIEVVRQGRHVDLVRIIPAMYPRLHEELSKESVSRTWRTRGRAVSTLEFEQVFLDDVTLALAAMTAEPPYRLLGVLQLLSFDYENQHAGLAVASFEAEQGSGRILEATLLFLDECFDRFPLNKLYARLSESSFAAVGALRGYFEVEGRLRDHLFIDSRRQDVFITAVTRDAFTQIVAADPLAHHCSPSGWRTSAWNDERIELRAASGPSSDRDLDLDALLDRLGIDVAGGSDVELRLDSLAAVELLVGLELLLEREIADEAILALATAGDIRRFVADLAPQAPAST